VPVVIIYAFFVAAQLTRIIFEEKVLRAAHPEYDAYKRKTYRLIPFVF